VSFLTHRKADGRKGAFNLLELRIVRDLAPRILPLKEEGIVLLPAARKVRKFLLAAVLTEEEVEGQRAYGVGHDLLIPDIGGVLAFPELIRLPLVHHHNNGPARRHPLILELERKEVGELARSGRVAAEEHRMVQ